MLAEFAPADTFEMNLECRFYRAARNIERQRGRRDPERTGLASISGIRPQTVGASEVVGSLEMKLHPAGGIGRSLGDDPRTFFPATGCGRTVAIAG